MSTQQGDSDARPVGRWDLVIDELHALRRAAGDPSFAEMTRRLIQQRMAEGQDEHAARIAKSSVHDAFRLGRSRLNIPLTRELVRMLGGDPALLDEWLARSDAPPAPSSPPSVESPPARVGPPPLAHVLVLGVACVLLNLLGRVFVDVLHLPLYLDMVGTAIAAIALGPWRGAAVGATTNVVGVIGSGMVSLPFALVNVAGALVWGYGVRRLALGRTLPRFFTLNLMVATVCTVVALPILAAYGETVGHGQDLITGSFRELTDRLVVALGASNLLTSLGDKLIAGFVALVAISALPLDLRSQVCLPLLDGGHELPQH